MPDDHELAENVRAEYAALVQYHNSIVTQRFALAGLLLAAVGFLAQDGLQFDEAIGVMVLTIGSYVVERRNRTLYRQMSSRAAEIEENHWKFNRSGPNDKTLPLFSRFLLRDLRSEIRVDLPENLQEELRRLEVDHRWCRIREARRRHSWIEVLPSSHSRGLDLVYLLIFVYALWQVVLHAWLWFVDP